MNEAAYTADRASQLPSSTGFFLRIYDFLLRVINLDYKLSVRHAPYVGWIGALGHPVYWVIWTFIFPQPYESFGLRFAASILCIPLIFFEKLPVTVEKWKPLYWIGSVTFVVPGIFFFLLLMNGFNAIYMTCSIMAMIMLLVFLHGVISIAISLTVGITTGYILFVAMSPTESPPNYGSLFEFSPLLVFALLVGIIFSRSVRESIQKEEFAKEREENLRVLTGSIAHEMRNPLGQIKYSLDCIQQNLPPPTFVDVQLRWQLNTIYRNLSEAQLAIKRGLQFIRMTLIEVKPDALAGVDFSYISAAIATQKAVEEYGYETENERGRVRVLILKDFIFQGNENLFTFVIFNLIKNALFYLEKYPKLTVTVIVDKPLITVEDSGPGIAQSRLPVLFEPFHSVEKAGGTGLGLAYCRRIMRRFGGEITCHSELGKYTRFVLLFPVISSAQWANFKADFLRRSAVTFKARRVLIVDDDEWLRTKARKMLEEVECRVDEVIDGAQALMALKRGASYDLILMDLNMPILDGYSTAKKIREGFVPHAQCTLIVAYTGEPEHLISSKVEKTGMDGIVSKSSNSIEFIKKLQTIVLERAKQTESIAAFAEKVIVVADDNIWNRLLVRGYLHRWKVKVIESENGQAVLDVLEGGVQVDAILMDMQMPMRTGIEVTKFIRSHSSYKHIPIIALTGDCSDLNQQTAFAAGVSDFLTKPVDPRALQLSLAKLLFSSERVISDGILFEEENELVLKSTPLKGGGNFAPLLDIESLDWMRNLEPKQLEEALAFMPQKLGELLEETRSTAARNDLENLELTLHSLLGLSGSLGATVLHQFIKSRVYPAIQEGRFPSQENWLDHLDTLGHQTAYLLEEYFHTMREESGSD